LSKSTWPLDTASCAGTLGAGGSALATVPAASDAHAYARTFRLVIFTGFSCRKWPASVATLNGASV
jgi:hypothetical protein